MHHLHLGPGQLQHLLGQFQHRELVWIAEVDRARHAGWLLHQAEETVDQVVNVTEGARLRAFAVDCQILADERLGDEIGDHAPIARMHARSVGVEDARHPDLDTMLAVIVEEECFRAALALVIAGPGADRVHVAPVVFLLGVNLRIAVDLAG